VGLEVLAVLEIEQRVDVLVREDYDVAALAPRPSVLDRVAGELILVEALAAVAAFSCFDLDLRSIYKHLGFRLLVLLWQDAD